MLVTETGYHFLSFASTKVSFDPCDSCEEKRTISQCPGRLTVRILPHKVYPIRESDSCLLKMVLHKTMLQ